jgi:hypothetical protein
MPSSMPAFGIRDNDPVTPNSAATLEAMAQHIASYAEGLLASDFARSVTRYGAKGDGQTVFDGATTTGSKALTSASGKFKAADVGKVVRVRAAGPGSANEVNTFTLIGSPTGGTFKFQVRGEESAALPYNASSGEVKAALEALAVVGAFNVEVSGGGGSPLVVTFVGSLGNTPVREIKTLPSLTGGTSPTINQVRTMPGNEPMLDTKISAYVSATEVTLESAAGTTVIGKEVLWGTDDTSAVNLAIVAANEAGGGTVLFRSGSHYIFSTSETTKLGGLTKWAVRMYSGVSLYGPGVTLHFPAFNSSTTANIVAPDGTDNWHILPGLHFHGHYFTETEANHHTVVVKNCSGWSVEETESEHFGGKEVYVEPGNGKAAEWFRIDRNNVHDHSSNAFGINRSFNWRIEDNDVANVQTFNTAEWLIGNTLEHGTVKKNRVRNWGNTNLCYSSTARFLDVLDNEVQLAQTGAIAGISLGAGEGVVEHCKVKGNTVDTSLVRIALQPNGITMASPSSEHNEISNNDLIVWEGAAIVWAASAKAKFNKTNDNEVTVLGVSGGAILGAGVEHSDSKYFNNKTPGTISVQTRDIGGGNVCSRLEIKGDDCVFGPQTASATTTQALRIDGSRNLITGGKYSTTAASANIGAVELFGTASGNRVDGATLDRPGVEGARHIYENAAEGVNNVFTGCKILGAKGSIFLRNASGSYARRSLGAAAAGAGVGKATIEAGASSVEVSHGMGYAPAPGEIQLTPVLNPTAQYWITAITAEKFKVNLSAAAAAKTEIAYLIG